MCVCEFCYIINIVKCLCFQFDYLCLLLMVIFCYFVLLFGGHTVDVNEMFDSHVFVGGGGYRCVDVNGSVLMPCVCQCL